MAGADVVDRVIDGLVIDLVIDDVFCVHEAPAAPLALTLNTTRAPPRRLVIAGFTAQKRVAGGRRVGPKRGRAHPRIGEHDKYL